VILVTPELVERVRALRASGLTLRRVARECGTAHSTIHKLLAGIPATVPPPVSAPEARHCQWICNDRKPWVWCTEPPDRPGGVWCAAHHRVVYAGRGSWPP
jgi:hypothetical protein